MVYMGSKSKYSSIIVPILQNIINKNEVKTYIEPFVGGANIIDKIICDTKYGYDKNQTLIALHKIGQENPSLIPEHGTPEWWYEAKDLYRKFEGKLEDKEIPMELWKIGAISFFASFSNGGFSRGYAKNSATRDYYNEAYRNFMAQISEPLYKDIIFKSVKDYKDIEIKEKSLIYCDPPYENTKPYGYKFEIGFNYNEYWDWIRQNSLNNFVVCSEQKAPDDFISIWTQDVKRTSGKTNSYKAVENLFIYKNGLMANFNK